MVHNSIIEAINKLKITTPSIWNELAINVFNCKPHELTGEMIEKKVYQTNMQSASNEGNEAWIDEFGMYRLQLGFAASIRMVSRFELELEIAHIEEKYFKGNAYDQVETCD